MLKYISITTFYIIIFTLKLVGHLTYANTFHKEGYLVSTYTKFIPISSEKTLSTPEAKVYANDTFQEFFTQANALPPIWLILPFIILLFMIASGPLLYGAFWHKNYPKISVFLACIVIFYYVFFLNNYIKPIEAFMEYIQFIALISGLYIASSGISIKINQSDTPLTNLIILLIGAVLANFIGTTGASMLLIRPYIRLNQKRINPYHIIFFIFIVSNIGGSLTPIGDPPLFLGFLKGVPFFWTLQHNFLPWLSAIILVSIIFFWKDTKSRSKINYVSHLPSGPIVQIIGKRNFIWLFLIIISVFIDPTIFTWIPCISYHGHTFSFLREILLLILTYLSYQYANSQALKNNAFSFIPIKEVVLIFIGIFGTMIPALTLISAFSQSDVGVSLINPSTLYWGTGIFSSVLDNAPTYLNFLAASMASQGADILQSSQVYNYAVGQGFFNSVLKLKAVSIASVFFGAMTYIGNGPNFMVKSIAEELGLRMPSFLKYITYFSIPFLLPTFFIIWLLFFYLQVF